MQPGGKGEKNPARILMIEDNSADVFILRHALEQHREPYRLDVLRDGEEALQFVRAQRTSPDPLGPCVIILDLRLPKHDGTTVLQAIREEPAMTHVRVVVLTSLASPRDEQEILDLGVSLYKTKPGGLDGWISFAEEILRLCGQSLFAHSAAIV